MKKVLIVIALALTGGLMLAGASGSKEGVSKVTLNGNAVVDDRFVGTWRTFVVNGYPDAGKPLFDFVFIDSSHFRIDAYLYTAGRTGEGTYTFTETKPDPKAWSTISMGEIAFDNIIGIDEKPYVLIMKYRFHYGDEDVILFDLDYKSGGGKAGSEFRGGWVLIKQ